MSGGEAYAVAFFSGTVSFTESLVGSVPPLTLTVIDSFFLTRREHWQLRAHGQPGVPAVHQLAELDQSLHVTRRGGVPRRRCVAAGNDRSGR
jgi:hypothetical protein